MHKFCIACVGKQQRWSVNPGYANFLASTFLNQLDLSHRQFCSVIEGAMLGWRGSDVFLNKDPTIFYGVSTTMSIVVSFSVLCERCVF